MSPIEVAYIGLGILMFLLFSGVPIGISFALVGFAGFAYLTGLEPALGMIQTATYRTFASYDLSVIPLFVLMGSICTFSGISQGVYRTVYNWIGFLRGGLAMATIGACAGFAAICGSSSATTATMAAIGLPEMKRCGYAPVLASGCVAAGGGIGILIPPSVIFIVYGLIVEEPIGLLLISGIIPGIIQTLLFVATIYLLCLRNPLLGPPGPKVSFREKVISLKDAWIVVVLFFGVMGGLYYGVFTPTEAAACGASASVIFAVVMRKLTWQGFIASLVDTVKTSAMIFLVVMGCAFFAYFLAVTRLPFELANFVSGLALSPAMIMAGILFLYLILGCFMEGLSIIFLTVPILFPTVKAMGFDPIWFGVCMIIVFQAGMITPPVGMGAFIVAGIDKDIPISTIFRGVLPFLIADMFLLSLLLVFPQIALFLPSLMK